MIRFGRALAPAGLMLLAAVTAPPEVAAQDTAQVAVDTLASADTLPPTVRRVLPIKAAETPPGPLPPGSRYVFTRESLLWSGAVTLSDLLVVIPGVYVARAGFLGLPEQIVYAGRGAAALELYWDGFRLEPLGLDTLYLDPGQIRLSLLRAVEVEVLPSTLRIYLISERHEGADPRSFINVMSGAFSTAGFAGMFQNRWQSGFALNTAADFLGTDGASGLGRRDQAFDVWAKVGWMPSSRIGAEYQLRRQDIDRDPAPASTGAIGVPELRGNRTDVLFTVFAGTRDDGLGFRVESGVGISSWSPDSASDVPEQHLRRAFVEAQYQTAGWTAAVRSTVGDARTLSEVGGRVGWVPVPGVVLAGDARWRRHEGGRISRAAHGSGGLYWGPVSLVGEVSIADQVQAPALLADTAIQTLDRAVRAGLETAFLSGHLGVVERDAYEPFSFPNLPLLELSPSPQATYFVADMQLRPSNAFTLSGWYSNPIRGTAPSLQPPTHARAAVTFRSKFWRTFRSGAFDLKLEAALESRGEGIAGLGAGGAPVVLPAATFVDLLLEFQIVGFTGFWNMRNAGNEPAEYVPGLVYPLSAQTFGVKWRFLN